MEKSTLFPFKLEEESKADPSVELDSQANALQDGVRQFALLCNSDYDHYYQVLKHEPLLTTSEIEKAKEIVENPAKARTFYTLDTLFLDPEMEYAEAIVALGKHYAPSTERVYYNTFLMGQALLRRRTAKILPWTSLKDLEKDLRVSSQTYADYATLHSTHPYIGPYCNSTHANKGSYTHHGEKISLHRDNWRNTLMSRIGGRREPPKEYLDDIRAMAIAERCLRFNFPPSWVFVDIEFIAAYKKLHPFLIALYDGAATLTFELTIDRTTLSTTDYNFFVTRYPQFERYVSRTYDEKHNKATWDTITALLQNKHILVKGGDNDHIILQENGVTCQGITDLGTPEGPLFLSQDKLASLLPDRFNTKHDPIEDMKGWVKLIQDVKSGLPPIKLSHVEGWCGVQMLYFLYHKHWTTDLLTLKLFKQSCQLSPIGTNLSRFRGAFEHTYFMFVRDLKHVDVFSNGSIAIQVGTGFLDLAEYGAKNGNRKGAIRATDPVRAKNHRKVYVEKTQPETKHDREIQRQARTDDKYFMETVDNKEQGSNIIYRGIMRRTDYIWAGQTKMTDESLKTLSQRFSQRAADIITLHTREGLYVGTGSRQTTCCILAVLIHLMWHPGYENVEDSFRLYTILQRVWEATNQFIDMDPGFLTSFLTTAVNAVEGLRNIVSSDGGILDDAYLNLLDRLGISNMGVRGEIQIVEMVTTSGIRFKHAWYLLYHTSFRHPNTRLQNCLADALDKGNIPGLKRAELINSIKMWMFLNVDNSVQAPIDILPYLSWRYRFSFKITVRSHSNDFVQHLERSASRTPKYVYLLLNGDPQTGYGHFELTRTELELNGPVAKQIRELENTIVAQKIEEAKVSTIRDNLVPAADPKPTTTVAPSDDDWVTTFPIAHLKKNFIYPIMLTMYPDYDINPVDGTIDVLQLVLITYCFSEKLRLVDTSFLPPGVPLTGTDTLFHPNIIDMAKPFTDMIFVEWPQMQRTYYTSDGKRCITQVVSDNKEISHLVDNETGKVRPFHRLPLPYEFQVHYLPDLKRSITVVKRIPIGDHIRLVYVKLSFEMHSNVRVLAALPVSSLSDVVNDAIDSRQHFPLALPGRQLDAMKLWFLGTDVIRRAIAEPASQFADMVQYVEVVTNAGPGTLDTESLRRAFSITLANNRYDRMLLDSTTSFYIAVWRTLMWAWERYGPKNLLRVPDSVVRGCVSDFMLTSVSVVHLIMALYFIHTCFALAWCLILVLFRGSVFDIADSFFRFTIGYWLYVYGYSLIIPVLLNWWKFGSRIYQWHEKRFSIFVQAMYQLGHRSIQQRRFDDYFIQPDFIYGFIPSVILCGLLVAFITYLYQTWRHPTFFRFGRTRVQLVEAKRELVHSSAYVPMQKRIYTELRNWDVDLSIFMLDENTFIYALRWDKAAKIYDHDTSVQFLVAYLLYLTASPDQEKHISIAHRLVLTSAPVNDWHTVLQNLRADNLVIHNAYIDLILANFESIDNFAMTTFCHRLKPSELGMYLHVRMHHPNLIMGCFENKQVASGEFGLASCRRDVELIANRAMGKQPYVPANQARIEKLYQIDPYSLPTLRNLTFRVGETKVSWHTFLNTITAREMPKKPSGEPVNLFDTHWNGVLPVRPDGRIINTLVALFNRHGSPPTLRDPTFDPHLDLDTNDAFKDIWKWDGEFTDEMGIKHDRFRYSSIVEYLTLVEPRKRASYVKGFANFKRKPRISKTLRAIPKNDESQYKKIHLHTVGLKNAIDSCKQRLIFNPSSELKANAGYVMHNIRKRIKRLPIFRFSSMTGRTPEEIQKVLEYWYAYIDKTIKAEDPDDFVVPLVYDGYQNDSTIDHLFIEQTDNVWIDKMFYRTCADLGYNVVQAEAIRRACHDIEIPFTCQLQQIKEHSYTRKKLRFNISGHIRGSVVSGHSSRTSDGNTNRLIILLKRIGHEAGLRFGVNYMIFQAGDDTKVFMPNSYVTRFVEQLKVYYTPYVDGMSQTVHGLGLCYQNLKVLPGQVDFLSKVGFLRPGYPAIMVREPSRVWKTGAYFDTKHLTLSEFNQALTYQLSSWVDPKTTLGYRTILSYRSYRKLTTEQITTRAKEYADLMQAKTRKERHGLTLIPSYSLFSISPLLRVMESFKALHPRLLFS